MMLVSVRIAEISKRIMPQFSLAIQIPILWIGQRPKEPQLPNSLHLGTNKDILTVKVTTEVNVVLKFCSCCILNPAVFKQYDLE